MIDSFVARRLLRSPVGPLTISATDTALVKVHFGGDAGALTDRGSSTAAESVLDSTEAQLAEYFDGTRREFDLPIDLVGTEFQVSAWRALANAPYGRTMSYATQAASIGRPTATRAVGAANGRNPVAIVLPCHRVVGSSGALTGFAGGLDVKRWLLDHEQRVMAADSRDKEAS